MPTSNDEAAARDVLGHVVSTRPLIQVPGQPPPMPPRLPLAPPPLLSPSVAQALARAERPPVQPIRLNRGQRYAGLVVLLVLVLGGAWFGWRAWHGVPVSLTAGGQKISNPDQVISAATAAFRSTAEADGAKLPAGAGCWFAPPAGDAYPKNPRMACGPVLLGISGDQDRWLVGGVSYSPASYANSSAGMKGTFGSFSDTADLNTHTLNGADRPGTPSGEPGLGGDGIRTKDGQILTGIDTALAQADSKLAATAQESGAVVGPDSRCYLGLQQQSRFGVRIRVSDGQIWCGPALLTDSGAGETWATFSLFTTTGDLIVNSVAREPSLSSIYSTKALTAGITLYRPDSQFPPGGSGGLQVPDQGPVEAGTVTVLDSMPAGSDTTGFTAPSDGRLITPSLAMKITSLGRVPKIGQGPDAIVAPAAHELLVAEFDVTRSDGGSYGNGTATLIAGGARVPVADWYSVKDHGVIAAVVPTGATDVWLEIVSEKKPQTISLVTGARGPGGPIGFYRTLAGITPGTPITVKVLLPKGDPAIATATVTQARVTAWTPDAGWAPDGSAFVVLTLDDWAITRPCCDVSGVDVTTRWAVRNELVHGGSPIAESAPVTSSFSTPTPVFIVPASLTRGAVSLQVNATYTLDGEQRRAAAAPFLLPFTVRS